MFSYSHYLSKKWILETSLLCISQFTPFLPLLVKTYVPGTLLFIIIVVVVINNNLK